MKKAILFAFLLSTVTPVARAQSDLSPNSSTAGPRIRHVPCPQVGEQQACDSFAELTGANDSTVSALVIPAQSSRALSFVCFADNQDAFFTVRYANSDASPKIWMFAATFFRDGIVDHSGGLEVVAMERVTQARLQDIPPPMLTGLGVPSTHVAVSESEVDIATSFENVEKGQTTRSLTVQLHTGRFKITGFYDDPPPAAGKPRGRGVLPDVEGRCVNLFDFVKQPPDTARINDASSSGSEHSPQVRPSWTSEELYAWQTYQSLAPDDREYVRTFCETNHVGAALVPHAEGPGDKSANHAVNCLAWLSARTKSQ